MECVTALRACGRFKTTMPAAPRRSNRISGSVLMQNGRVGPADRWHVLTAAFLEPRQSRGCAIICSPIASVPSPTERQPPCHGKEPCRAHPEDEPFLSLGSYRNLAPTRSHPMHAPSTEIQKARLKSLTRRFWRTARHFWTGDRRRVAWLMTLSLVAFVVLQLFVQYRLNVWNRTIFDALEKKDAAVVLGQALIFFPLAATSIAVAVTVVYLRMRAQRRWRSWLTEHLIDR